MVLNFAKKIIVFSIIFFLCTTKSFAQQSTVLIINQVRGTEDCCHNGNTDIIEALTKDSELKTIPIAWALRYDSLDNEFTSHFDNDDSLGLLLEITPKLAKESNVVYKGNLNGQDWYSAKNAFLIGYTKDERKKLLDTVFAKFHQTFGYYPIFSVAWMIDAYSLNYIHDTYGVRLHELTKEQYETDSYTLYGGTFNTPYYPSKLHPLVPGTKENKMNIIMVRQTISDPLKNYGSQKAYFTSQPNDYLANPKTPKNYFESLVDTPFGLIGFENSYNWDEYGKEYLKQLEYLKSQQNQGNFSIQKIDDFIQIYTKANSENKPQELKVPDATWYFGKTYRARLLKKNNEIILDDLRVYEDTLTDPYENVAATSDFAYWIIPYVFDGSQMYTITKDQKTIAQKEELFSDKTIPDILTNPFGVSVKKEKENSIHFNETTISIDKDANPQFTNGDNLSFKKILTEKKDIKLRFPKHPDFLIHPNNKILEVGWVVDGKDIVLLEIQDNGKSYELIPKIKNPEYVQSLNSIFQPDRETLPLNENKTIIYWNNTLAIAGRNPVRVFILPQNKYSRPTRIKNIQVIETTKNVDITYPKDYSYRVSPWFIDITAPKKLNTKIDIILDGKTLAKGVTLSFAPDCQLNLKDCLMHPEGIFAYISAILDEKKRSFMQTL